MASTRKEVEGATIHEQAGVSVIDQVGITVCIITSERRLLYLGLCVKGRIITKESLAYLSEAAILHGLRALHGSLQSPEGTATPVEKIHMRAGRSGTAWALAHWFRSGDLTLQSQIASPLAEDIDRGSGLARTSGLAPSFSQHN